MPGDADGSEASHLGGGSVLQGDEEGGDEVWLGEVGDGETGESVVVLLAEAGGADPADRRFEQGWSSWSTSSAGFSSPGRKEPGGSKPS